MAKPHLLCVYLRSACVGPSSSLTVHECFTDLTNLKPFKRVAATCQLLENESLECCKRANEIRKTAKLHSLKRPQQMQRTGAVAAPDSSPGFSPPNIVPLSALCVPIPSHETAALSMICPAQVRFGAPCLEYRIPQTPGVQQPLSALWCQIISWVQ